MTPDELVEKLLTNAKWSELQTAMGPATDVPDAFRALISAKMDDEVEAAYWRLDNHVVVQGSVYESAIPVVPVILAALIETNRPSRVRLGLLELLFQIVHSESTRFDAWEDGVHFRCRNVAQSGLWLIYRELITGSTEAIRHYSREILEVLELDVGRRSLLLKS